MGFTNVTHSSKQRLHCTENSPRMIAVRPELFQAIFVEKGSSQVRLRIEIGRKHTNSKIRVHPCEVVDEGGLSNSALVVKESDYVYAHGRLLDRKSTRLNSSHGYISYAVFCL